MFTPHQGLSTRGNIYGKCAIEIGHIHNLSSSHREKERDRERESSNGHLYRSTHNVVL